MLQLDGLGLLRATRTGAHDIDVVLMTAFDDMPTVAAAMRRERPISCQATRPARAAARARRVLDDRRARTPPVVARGEAETRSVLADLVGRDPR